MTNTKTWRKSSRSATNDQCVELPSTLDGVRDSKNPSKELPVSAAGMVTFVRLTKQGVFVL